MKRQKETRQDAQEKSISPEQADIARKASKDVQSSRVDTDCYDTSGNDQAPPKTPDDPDKSSETDV